MRQEENMENEYNMTINRLPSKTWNWLRMNETQLEKVAIPTAGDVKVNLPERITTIENENSRPWNEDFAGIASGMGEDMDGLLSAAGVKAQQYEVPADVVARQPLLLDYEYTQDSLQAGAVAVRAQKNSEITIIQDFASDRAEAGQAEVSTRLYLEEGAKIRLVQIQRLGSGFTFMNDIGALCEEKASLEVIQLILGGKNTYLGCKTTLQGRESSMNADTAYIVAGDGRLDMNYVASHEGKKTQSNMQAGGVLRDHAFKLYRGTIDFKWGAKGAAGNEKEDVLLLSNDVVNQTIPLILCAEEDVEGNHGATIGKLDDELLFYLESRGMTREQIYEMMAMAKVDAVCRKIPDAATQAKVQEFLGRTCEEE